MSPVAVAGLILAGYLTVAGVVVWWAFRHDDKVTDALAPLEVPGDDDLMTVADAVQDDAPHEDPGACGCDACARFIEWAQQRSQRDPVEDGLTTLAAATHLQDKLERKLAEADLQLWSIECGWQS